VSDDAAGAARERWNARYDADTFEPFPPAPAEWLVEHRDLLAGGAGRTAIDVACGDGRNARALAELGFAVDAVDLSDVVIERLRVAAAETGLRVVARAIDLERDALPANAYDVVVCMNYLQRNLFDALGAALRPGGLLLYETFAQAHVEELGRTFNPAFVLGHNELLRAFGDLHVVHYREGVAERRGGPRGVASLVARRLAASG
jgi:2-polyprenyl-3-methyl-5-hydroxy-6-metoxy-1,4-benzoquinol methylase